MALLAPLFLLGLAALAVPVLLHLSQRARREPVRFPSLAFVRRVPFKTTERRRLRDRLLLLLRAAALALLAVAFARPLFEKDVLGAAGAAVAREVVILLDGSASMAYGDHWRRARDAVREVGRTLGAEDQATLVLFTSTPTVLGPPTADPVQLDGYLAAAEPHGAATRYAPALDLARDIVEQSARPRSTVVLITDFQRSGWDGRVDVRLPAGTAFEPVSVADGDVANLAVVGVMLQRTPDDGGRVTVTARVANLGGADVDVQVELGTGQQGLHERSARVAAGAVSQVTFPAIALPAVPTPAWTRITGDRLAVDDVHHFVLRPIPRIRVLVIEPSGQPEREMLYLRRALAIGRDPALAPTTRTSPSVGDVNGADVVILNDAPFPAGDAGRALTRFVERGGGVLWALGAHARSIPADLRAWAGDLSGPPVDRVGARGGVLGIADYGHPIFAPFRNARGGDYGAVRIYRYRRLAPPDSARVLAWTDDGAPVLVESRLGSGRVLLWASDLGNAWNDLAVRSVFLPTIHEAVRYLAGYREPPASYVAGQAVEPADLGGDTVEMVLEAPDGARTSIAAGSRSALLLERAGLYALRPMRGGAGVPFAANLDPAESDLAQLDRSAFVAAVAGAASSEDAPARAGDLTAEERERRQRLWWYAALAALAILVAESMIAGVRPRGMGT